MADTRLVLLLGALAGAAAQYPTKFPFESEANNLLVALPEATPSFSFGNDDPGGYTSLYMSCDFGKLQEAQGGWMSPIHCKGAAYYVKSMWKYDTFSYDDGKKANYWTNCSEPLQPPYMSLKYNTLHHEYRENDYLKTKCPTCFEPEMDLMKLKAYIVDEADNETYPHFPHALDKAALHEETTAVLGKALGRLGVPTDEKWCGEGSPHPDDCCFEFADNKGRGPATEIGYGNNAHYWKIDYAQKTEDLKSFMKTSACKGISYGAACSWGGDRNHMCQNLYLSGSERLTVRPCFDTFMHFFSSCTIFVNSNPTSSKYEPSSYMAKLSGAQLVVVQSLYRAPDKVCNPYSYYYPSLFPSSSSTASSASSKSATSTSGASSSAASSAPVATSGSRPLFLIGAILAVPLAVIM